MTPLETPQGTFPNCKVNGFKWQALLDTRAETTIEVLYNHIAIALSFWTAVTIKDSGDPV